MGAGGSGSCSLHSRIPSIQDGRQGVWKEKKGARGAERERPSGGQAPAPGSRPRGGGGAAAGRGRARPGGKKGGEERGQRKSPGRRRWQAEHRHEARRGGWAPSPAALGGRGRKMVANEEGEWRELEPRLPSPISSLGPSIRLWQELGGMGPGPTVGEGPCRRLNGRMHFAMSWGWVRAQSISGPNPSLSPPQLFMESSGNSSVRSLTLASLLGLVCPTREQGLVADPHEEPWGPSLRREHTAGEGPLSPNGRNELLGPAGELPCFGVWETQSKERKHCNSVLRSSWETGGRRTSSRGSSISPSRLSPSGVTPPSHLAGSGLELNP
ncbi:collagen alpha-2(XI) chain-like [Erinaceus europaeus]|uniref:Collagen alpha-2(XI) chain-like n=1 Tax=Erinaceus europaeus TaxID=9365 RepID=A0ABM3WA27_ERIEU|nr:collagen alpha-2(XI) chain-like [Erinaceus europaeus]